MVVCPSQPAGTPRAFGAPRYSPFSTTRRTYWTNLQGKAVLSDSQSAIARLKRAPLSASRIALALCGSLPSVLRQLPFWEGIEAVPAGHAAHLRGETVTSSPAWSVTPSPDLTFDEASARLRSSLLRTVRQSVACHGKVSSDVSGGMDSTSLAYFLSEFTEHPTLYHASTADPQNQDTRHARRAAAEIGGHLVELASFTDTMTAFSGADDAVLRESDDGPLTWRSNAAHLRGLIDDAAFRGVRAHLMGLGGDELFSILPALSLAMCADRPRRWSSAIAGRLAKMQRWSRSATLRAVASQETLAQELLRRVRTRDPRHDEPADAFGWASGFAISPFATDRAAEMVEGRVEDLVRAGVEPHFEDRYRHQVAESVMFQGEVIRQMNHVFHPSGVTIEAPFIDDDVLSLVFGLHPKVWADSPLSKPLLAAAAGGIVPGWVFARPDKGEYSKDLFAEYIRRRDELRRLFDESWLVDHRYVDPDRIVHAIDAPLLGTEQLFDLEHLASVEYWVRRVA